MTHVTDFENWDRQHKFQEMMDLAEEDVLWIDWIKMSRLTFGPWRIEGHEPFRVKYGQYIDNYDEDAALFSARVRRWITACHEAAE